MFLQAFSAALLFVRCTAIDPSDRTYRDKKRKAGKNGGMCRSRKLNYKFIIYQIAVRFIRKMEYWILRSCIRRRYLDPWRAAAPPIEPLLPFPLVSTDDAIAPHLKDNDISFCPLCDFEVLCSYLCFNTSIHIIYLNSSFFGPQDWFGFKLDSFYR